MRNISLVALLLFQCVLAFAQPYTPATVPNVKLVNNSYVSNPDGIISASTEQEINSTLANLESQTTVQVAVVVLDSIGDADDFTFAQELYNLWGIGQANSNGLLILVSIEPRHLRFHTGYGLESTLPDILCKQIHRDDMIPSFKEGDYDGGLINGVKEVARILSDPNYAEELRSAAVAENSVNPYSGFIWFVAIFLLPVFLIAWAAKSGKFSDSKPADPTNYPQMRYKRSTWLIVFGLIPLLIVVFWGVFPSAEPIGNGMITMYLYLMITAFVRWYRERRMVKSFVAKQKFYELTEYYRKSTFYWIVMGLIFPLPLILYFPFHIVRKNLFRNHSRTCNNCDGKMRKLSETDDDQFLNKAQLVEEQIKSVDYDVWQCEKCNSTEAWHFPNRLSKYSECPSCKAKAYYRVSDKTIKAATYSSSGEGESVHECKACNKKKKERYTIAQLVRSNSSSSSSGSSYSSSSSSSGGSWGGGRSGGGGASSSW